MVSHEYERVLGVRGTHGSGGYDAPTLVGDGLCKVHIAQTSLNLPIP